MSADRVPVAPMIPIMSAPPIGRAPCAEAGGLLHNMSAPPKSVVKFSGLSSLADPALAQGRAQAEHKYLAPSRFGTLVRFELAPEWRTLTPAQMLVRLAALGETGALFGDAPGTDHSQSLAALIDQHARRLPLPPGCAVVASHPDHAAPWRDPLTALAILSKCTDTVWLRDKQPSLVGTFERGVVSLLLPPGFDAPLAGIASIPGAFAEGSP